MIEFIGQALGILAVILGFVSFQMKTPKGILIFQILASAVFAIHYLLIGAITAMALNLLGCIKCGVYYIRNKRGLNGFVAPAIFTTLTIITSIMTWGGWVSALIMVGLVVNTISLALPDANKTRMFMFIKSPLCLAYNLLVKSGGGVIYECAVLTSSLIGIITNRKTKTNSEVH